jgi:NTE family protein
MISRPHCQHPPSHQGAAISGLRPPYGERRLDGEPPQHRAPRNVFEVATRQKEIQYSSRTRANTDHFKHLQRIRGAIANLLDKLPEELWDSEEVKALNGVGDRKVYNLVHLIYRPKNHEGHSKDYEFSRLSMHDHWRAGYEDALRGLRHPEVIERPRSRDGVFIFDLQSDHKD